MQFFVSLAVCVRADEANNCCLNSLHSPNDDPVPSKVKFFPAQSTLHACMEAQCADEHVDSSTSHCQVVS